MISNFEEDDDDYTMVRKKKMHKVSFQMRLIIGVLLVKLSSIFIEN
jgi:hypothetical protein